MARAVYWVLRRENCREMVKTQERESLWPLLCSVQDVNRLNKVLFNTFQDVTRRPHYKA